MQVIHGKAWEGLGVATAATVAPSPHPLRAGAGYPMRGGRWAGPSNSENGSEPLAGVFEIFIFILSREVKVKSAYGQGGLPSKGIWARARTHFRM